MSRRRRPTALAVVALLLFGGTRPMWGQDITIRVRTVADSISPAPAITVLGTPLPPDAGQATLTLEMSLNASFSAPFLVRSTTGVNGSFFVDRLMPEQAVVHLRARVFDASGAVREQKIDSFPVRSWLRLVSPTVASNNVLFTRQPRFTWSSPEITLPPGPWAYQLSIVNTRTGIEDFVYNTGDTSFVLPNPIDACTSYKWRVFARAQSGGPNDQLVVASPGTFVIQAAECPTTTIFYQNFPNPFGGGGSDITCFWFDLAHRSTVTLTVYDLRLREVRKIIPGAIRAALDSGAHGRENGSSESGCDDRISWDGRDDNGRTVPPGVYIAVFVGDGVRSTRKILFRGR
jgi:hypothetical protein